MELKTVFLCEVKQKVRIHFLLRFRVCVPRSPGLLGLHDKTIPKNKPNSQTHNLTVPTAVLNSKKYYPIHYNSFNETVLQQPSSFIKVLK